MKVRSNILCSIATAFPLVLSGCGSGGTAVLPEYIAVAISPRPATVAQGGTATFTASVSNNLGVPQWSILAAADTPNAGTLTPVNGSSNTMLYTAPPNPPIYNSSAPAGFTQGSVTVAATTTAPAGTSIPVVGDSVSFIITAPSVTVSLSPTSATVARGATQQFVGYAIGNYNYALTWQVDGFTGGGVPVAPPTNPATYTYPYGTVSSTGLYTAPASLPAGPNLVTVTVISQADPTQTESADITLQ